MKKLLKILKTVRFKVLWIDFWFGIILTLLLFIALKLFLNVVSADAQNVVQKGNTFYQQQSNSNKIERDSAVFSGYHYFDTKGIRYPIYISSKGKCFIFRTSAKTGKQYKQYLPEITKQLSNGRK